jgi:uncharacterized protein YndB with AHSA1/START domain
MSNAPEAVLQDQDGRAMLRFERVLPHPPEKVWRALTERDELASWHPSLPKFEPVAGGTVTYSPEGGWQAPDGEVTEYDPPRVLGYTWGEDHLRWEVQPREDGCALVLVHTFDDRFKAARDAAGWQMCLDNLSRLLDGAQKPPGEEPGEVPPEWSALNRQYETLFGIPPEKATPPPGR